MKRKRRLALLAFLWIPVACGSDRRDAGLAPGVILARDRAADLGARARWSEARAILEPLVEGPDAPLEDLLRAASAELAQAAAEGRVERATALVERVAARR